MSRLEIYKDRKNFLLLNHDDILNQTSLLDSWECIEGRYLKKRYDFVSYQEAKKFVDWIVDFAENINHHPQLLFGYKFVEALIWTHNVNGLSKVDFAYAQDLDSLYLKVIAS